MPEIERLAFRNEMTEIDRLHDILDAFGTQHGMDRKCLYHLKLAVEEMATNVIKYAWTDGAAHEFTIALGAENGEAVVEIEDDGREFNPLAAPEPNLKQSIEDRPIGGLGIHLVRQTMTGLDYERREGKNRLRMRKSLRES